MDVRCERCRAQYVFDDEQVTASGLTVQCTNCGHVFKVKKKELVVTVPVKPDELEGTPLPATAAAPKPGGSTPVAHGEPREPTREWRVRQASGNIFTFRELTTLQKWIIEQKVSRDDEISLSGDQWKRLGNIAELASFFQVVEAAERGRMQAAGPAVTPLPMPAVPVYGVALQAPLYAPPPPPGYGTAPYPPPPYVAPPAPPAPEPPPPPVPTVEVDLGPDEPAAPRRRRGKGAALAVALLLVAAGALAYVFVPQLRGTPPAPSAEAVAVPLTIELKPAETAAEPPAPQPAEPPAPPVAPVPAPEPVVEAAVEPPPEPIVKPVAKTAPTPRGPKALLAEAARLREKGDVERALDLYGRVAGDDPENVDALTGRGLCYLDLETYPPAEASFLAALALRPDSPDALLGLAETYRWQGKKADAIRYYERYLAAHPTGDEASVARNALEELRN